MGVGATRSTRARSLLRTVVWALTFFVAVIYSRNLAVVGDDGIPVALISPSSAIGLLWLASARTRTELVTDSVGVVLAASVGLWFAAAVGWTSHPPFEQYALILLAPIQYLVAIYLMRRWVPHLWGGGGRASMRTLPELGLVLLAMTVGILAFNLLRIPAGELLIPAEDLALALGRGTRSLSAMATLGLVGFLIGGWLSEAKDADRPAFSRPSGPDVASFLGATVAAVLVVDFDFFVAEKAPATFLLTLVIAWVAIRFSPLMTGVFCVVAGSVIIAFTIENQGPLTMIEDVVVRAALAQLLVVVLMILGLVISLSRRQVLDTVARLEQSERANARRAEELDLVMANLVDGVAIIEADGRIAHANPALRTGFGTQEPEELDKARSADEIPDEEKLVRGSDGAVYDDENSPLTRALAGEEVQAEEWRTLKKDTPIKWVTISGVPLPPDENGLTRAMLVLRDISSEKEHQQALETRAAELHTVIDKLNDGLAIIEEGGLFIHANDALGEIMNGQRGSDSFQGEVDRDDAYHLFHPDGVPMAADDYPYMHALEGVEIHEQEFHLRRPNSPVRILSISAYPLPVKTGAKQRVMVVVRDVTNERSYQEGLASFAGTVAHDLNNPLSVIDGWAEAMQEDLAETDDPVATGAAGMVQHIRGGVDQMRGFIADLLAHAVARDQMLNTETVSLRNMVKHIATGRDRQDLPMGGIVLGELPDVWADKLLVRQVLDNLIGNATKYVAPGTDPEIRVEATADDDWVEVTVRDNGIGIPPEQREQVFDSFHRASQEGYVGTGLGLAICKRIVERHGGSIRVDGNPDGGSSFVFTLPRTSQAFAAATGR